MVDQSYTLNYHNSWALVLGVDKYQHLPRLSAAVRGAADLAAVLRDSYGFDVSLLTDQQVTRGAVLGWLNDRADQVTRDDRVLIYFAGHGLTRGEGVHERGYLALVDSAPGQWHTTLPMDDVSTESQFIKAKHLLYILDCCFGGLALEARAAPDIPREVNYYLTRPARYAISAGGREFVDDALAPDGQHSLFTYHFLQWLTDERMQPPGGIWRARELGNYLEWAVARDRRSGHKPNHNYLPGSGDGDFLFAWQTGQRLPRDLEMALRSDIGAVRWGAVAALIDFARGDDPSLADSAGEKLAGMAQDDPDERVRGAAQSFFDEEEALRLAEEDKARKADAEAKLAEARRLREEAELRAEEERQRQEAAERERQEALERARQAREITPTALGRVEATAAVIASVAPLSEEPVPPSEEVESTVSPVPRWGLGLPLLMTALAWALGWAIVLPIAWASGWNIVFVTGGPSRWGIVGAILAATVGAIGGLVTGLALRRAARTLQWKQIGLITLGWAIGWALGGALGELVGAAIGGAIGGLVTGLALRRVAPSTQWKGVGLVTLGWAIGWDIAFAIGDAIGDAIGWALGGALGDAIAWAIVGAIVGAIGGALGGGTMLLLLSRAQRARAEASSRRAL